MKYDFYSGGLYFVGYSGRLLTAAFVMIQDSSEHKIYRLG